MFGTLIMEAIIALKFDGTAAGFNLCANSALRIDSYVPFELCIEYPRFEVCFSYNFALWYVGTVCHIHNCIILSLCILLIITFMRVFLKW